MIFQEEMRRRGFLFLSGEPGVMPALHRHREVEVSLVVNGELVYLFGGARVVVLTGQIAVFWATLPHQVVWCAEGTRYYCVHLPQMAVFITEHSSVASPRRTSGCPKIDGVSQS